MSNLSHRKPVVYLFVRRHAILAQECIFFTILDVKECIICNRYDYLMQNPERYLSCKIYSCENRAHVRCGLNISLLRYKKSHPPWECPECVATPYESDVLAALNGALPSDSNRSDMPAVTAGRVFSVESHVKTFQLYLKCRNF